MISLVSTSMLGLILETKLMTWLGAFALFKLCLAIIPPIYRKIYSLLFTHKKNGDLRYYGEWAVVTGSTDGIGKAFAIELANRGLGIILISRNEENLKNVASKIEEEYGVKVFYIEADFTDRGCYNNIKKKLEGKDIGILVNNVGMARRDVTLYTRIDEDFIWNELDVNCGSVFMMTRIVLPQMIAKRKGLVVNISSLSTMFGSPGVGIYAATKSFINMFSRSVQMEMDKYDIKFKCLIPGFVETKMTKLSRPFFEAYPSIATIFCPDAKSYAESAVNSFNEDGLFATGYWGHSLMRRMFLWMSMKQRIYSTQLFIKLLHSYANKKRRQ